MGQNCGIHITYPASCLGQHLHHGIQQLQAVRSRVSRVSIGKRLSDVSQSRSTQQSVHDSMGQDIRIRVAQQTFFKGNIYPAQNELSSLCQPMHIIAMSDPHVSSSHSSSASAIAMSSGVVTFRLR